MIEQFTHPTLHLIQADKQVVLLSEEFAAGRWLDDGEIINRGQARYKVLRQQKGVHHYYVWAEKVN